MKVFGAIAMEAAMLERIQKRLDKECGNGWISDRKQCNKQGGGVATVKKTKSSNLGRNLAIVGGALGAAALAGGAAYHFSQRDKTKSLPSGNRVNPGASSGSGGGPGSQKRTSAPSSRHGNASKTWHEVLEVDEDASPEEIKAAYRRKSRETHPDLNNGKDKGFGAVNEAYQKARSRKRDHLDSALYEGLAHARRRADAASSPVPATFNPQIREVIANMYGPGVARVSPSRVNQDGVVSGVFLGRSRPNEPLRSYSYGIDLLSETGKFKRLGIFDTDDEETCDGKKGCECSSCKH